MKTTLSFLPLACALAAPLLAAGAFRWDTATPSQLALFRDGAQVWRFHYDAAQSSKPYFDPVCVVGGPSLTWARPPDHAWHYGLWFSWKYINGLNYWEEKAGKSQGETAWDAPKIEMRPDGRADIRLSLTYRPTATAAPVLKETRTVAISAPDAEGAYHMDWTQVFTAGETAATLDRTPLAHEPNGKSWGGYAGLSVRYSKAFTNLETVASTVGRVPRAASGRLDTVAAAAEQNGFIAGQPYGIALLTHPANPRAPGDWYPIETPSVPFYYLNAAFLLTGAYTLQPAETLTLRYRVCVHPGRWDVEALRRAAADYAAAPPAAPGR
jgi:hypothetical protein